MIRNAVTVTQLNEYVRNSLSEDPMLSDVIVVGELSGVKNHSSGHIYFSLKDSGAVIRCAFFKPQNLSLNFKLNDGTKVLARGRVTLYARDGQYQLNVTSMQKDGIGELYQRFELLKAKLEEEGLFDNAHKRSIPTFAKKIGVVTSPTGAVIRDIINVATRRFYGINIVLAPVQVQGDDAPRSICAGIEYLNKINDIDVIIVGRGGGSIEDLWAFNEETVAQAIFNSHIPVISAVGHETDFTIADFVSDMRAPTPSAAAELAVPDINMLIRNIKQLEARLGNSLDNKYNEMRKRLQRLSTATVLTRPEMLLNQYWQRIDNVSKLLEIGVNRAYLEKSNSFAKLVGKLNALSPLAVLERGYSAVSDMDGNTITDAEQLSVNDSIKITFAKGKAKAKIEQIEV